MVLGMLVVDAEHGSRASNDLFGDAVRDWAAILQLVLPEAAAWAKRICPEPQGPVVHIPEGKHIEAPVGSMIVGQITAAMDRAFTEGARRRSEEA
jgi:hypothetical protein